MTSVHSQPHLDRHIPVAADKLGNSIGMSLIGSDPVKLSQLVADHAQRIGCWSPWFAYSLPSFDDTTGEGYSSDVIQHGQYRAGREGMGQW